MDVAISQRKKGVKVTALGLSPNESVKFPRRSYSTVRTTLSTIKIEYPERLFNLDIIDDGILVTCLK